MDAIELKQLITSIQKQQASIIRTQKQILNRLEVIEEVLELVPPAETPLISRDEQPKLPVPPATKQKSTTAPNSDNLELKIGGTWFNRAGAIAVILGLSYFLKYSFDNQWIGPTGRIILGLMFGLILLGLGERLRHNYSGYAQGLVGAGSLALYFSVYSAYNFYQLISPAWAFLFLIVVMTNTIAMAVKHDAKTVGVLGILGGYAVPLLISTGTPQPWIFFTYLAILTFGILGVSVYKRWDLFRLLSFIFNQLLVLLWNYELYQIEHLWPTYSFLLINFAAYLLIASLYNIRHKTNVTTAEAIIIAANGLLFFTWSYELLRTSFLANYIGFYALAIAVIYIYLGRLAFFLHPEDKKQVYILFALAIKLIALAVYLQLDGAVIAYLWLTEAFTIFYLAGRLQSRVLTLGGLAILSLGTFSQPIWVTEHYLTMSWLGEAVALMAMGTKLKEPFIRNPGIATFALAALISLNGASHLLSSGMRFLLNWPSLMLGCVIVVGAILYYFFQEWEPADRYVRVGEGVGVLVLIFAFLTMENNHFFDLHKFTFFLSPEQLSLSILWMLYSVGLFVAGIIKELKELRYAALGLIGIIIIKAFFIDLTNLATIFKILLFIVLGLFLLGISFVYQKKQSLFNRSDAL